MEGTEWLRRLNELALSSGKKRQSPQTGYIHVCYNLKREEAHLPIPLVENALFVLALLRSRTSENMLEGKEMLSRLLFFQNTEKGSPSEGNFPIYLHEFPQCKDRWTGVKLLLPFYWILTEFHSILGTELKAKLEQAFLKILEHGFKTYQEKPAPYPTGIKLAASACAGGKKLGAEELVVKGERLLNALHADQRDWSDPEIIGSMIASLQMVYPQISSSPWQDFWQVIQSTWHVPTASYIGKMKGQFQNGSEPSVSLYDLYMGYLSEAFSERALKDQLVHLEGSLIRPVTENISSLLPSHTTLDQTQVFKEQKYAYSLSPDSVPFTLIWGNQKRMHSLTCQNGNIKSCTSKNIEGGVELFFTLGDSIDVEEREKNREIMFFIDRHQDMKIHVDEYRATTFQLGETVKIQSGGLNLSLSFQLEDGEGQFLGHILPGNRPSQIGSIGTQRFEAFDWQIFLRTLRRSNPCTIKVTIQGLRGYTLEPR